LGGGVIGCEAGLWLAQQGKEVTIIELLPDILMAGIPIQHMNRLMLLDLLRFNEIRIMTNTSAINFENGNLILSDNGNKSREQLWAEDIVLAVGLQADQVLYKSLRSKIPDLFLIGDARHPQNILNAIWDAFHVAQII